MIIDKNKNVQAMLGAYCDNHRLCVSAFPTVFIVYDLINTSHFQDILSFIGPCHILRSWECLSFIKTTTTLLLLFCLGGRREGWNNGIEYPKENTKHFVGIRFEE